MPSGNVRASLLGESIGTSSRRRLLTDVELARLQGMSTKELELVGSTTLLKNMVGNSFSAPVIGALLLGICAALGGSQR